MDLSGCSPCEQYYPPPVNFGCGHDQGCSAEEGFLLVHAFQCVSQPEPVPQKPTPPHPPGYIPCPCDDTKAGTITEDFKAEQKYAAEHGGAVEKVFDEGAYVITVLPAENNSDLTKITILDTCTNQTTTITGDPNVRTDSGQKFQFNNTLNFDLKDGTHVQLQTQNTMGSDGKYHEQISSVVMQNNINSADVTGVNHAYAGVTTPLGSNVNTSGPDANFMSGQHTIYLQGDGNWGFTPGQSNDFSTNGYFNSGDGAGIYQTATWENHLYGDVGNGVIGQW